MWKCKVLCTDSTAHKKSSQNFVIHTAAILLSNFLKSAQKKFIEHLDEFMAAPEVL